MEEPCAVFENRLLVCFQQKAFQYIVLLSCCLLDIHLRGLIFTPWPFCSSPPLPIFSHTRNRNLFSSIEEFIETLVSSKAPGIYFTAFSVTSLLNNIHQIPNFDSQMIAM